MPRDPARRHDRPVTSPAVPSQDGPTVLLTGATGYVGGRLLPILEARGARVRCLTRRPTFLSGRVGARTTSWAAT